MFIRRKKKGKPRSIDNDEVEFIVIEEDTLVPILCRDTALKMNLIELKPENILTI